jgi:glycosyltransferase involved in cell wall biosynthesis
LTGRVRFTGFLASSELERLYLDASVFAFSSVWPEPFGMAGPEAMRFGVPVAGFDTGAVREWLHDGENGFVAPWGDTTAFAAGIEKLLRDKELARRLGLNGRERVNREYNAGRQVEGIERLFLQITCNHDRPGQMYDDPAAEAPDNFAPPVIVREEPVRELVLKL